jgi:His/Glu/Gln/Arg/opine family amino acid ABC transporter permease subunit
MNVNWIDIIVQLSDGMWRSLLIFVLTLLFSMPLGLVIAFGRMSKWAPLRVLRKHKNPICRFLASLKPIQLITKLYISVLRGTPLMLQLLVIYFGPYYIFGVSISMSYQFYAVIIAFSINYSAYFAEIYRSGIEAIPKGQYEAAQVLGYTKSQTFRKIILPQVIKVILPPTTNEIITLTKDTSLSFVLAYAEMFTEAKFISAATTSMVPLAVAGMTYYFFNLLVAVVMEKVEARMDYTKR